MALLEEDEAQLQQVYPQGEEADMLWAMTVVLYVGLLLFGILGSVTMHCCSFLLLVAAISFHLRCSCRLILSFSWVIHIIVYMLVQPPSSIFLNALFMTLDSWWGTDFAPLHGDASFAMVNSDLRLSLMQVF